MELEEMKQLWETMSQRVEKQQLLTNKLIIQMTQERYTTKLSKIQTFETAGSVICFVMAAFVLFNFGKLDTWYLVLSGILVLLALTLLPILVLRSIFKMKHLDLAQQNFRESLVEFGREKQRFLFLQRLNIGFGFLIMFAALPVASKLLSNKDIFETGVSSFTWIYLGAAVVGLALFARWGYGCYRRITQSAENLLKELED
ncbi:MAG: hypothetical protein AAFP76_12140 [Bacteroidota bacterium]